MVNVLGYCVELVFSIYESPLISQVEIVLPLH